MDLFIVNRHLDVEQPVGNDEEEVKLKATLNRIEKNRAKRQKRRVKEQDQKQLKWDIIQRRIVDNDFKYIQPDTNQAYFDDNIDEFAKKLEGDVDEDSALKEESKVIGDTSKEVKKQKTKKRKIESGETIDGFTVLATTDLKQESQVKRVLPEWLSNPTVISVDLQNLQTKVSSIKCLSKQLRNKLKAENIKYLFPVQATVIPYLLNSLNLKHCMSPRDICVSAPTGSGKTLAFALPIIQALQDTFIKRIRALIILPTQDLATQVFHTFKKYTEGTKLDVCLATGGTQFLLEQKELVVNNAAFGWVSRVDILVGTAGRLVDHIKHTPGFTLEYLEYLVVDEADRVLDNVQNDWLYHLEKHIYNEEPTDLNILNLSNYRSRRAPQKLLFSATLSQDPEKLHKLGLFQPKLFTSIIEGEEKNVTNISENFIGKYTTPKELTEKYIITSLDLKPLVLYQFIKNENLSRTLVFTHSLENAHRLKVLLQNLFGEEGKIEEIGSKLDGNLRNKLIKKFNSGEIDILICTDALARGIDLCGVQCVISYSAPKHLNTYIHRAGRTARAGEQGLAVTMLVQEQLTKFNEMLSRGEKTTLQEIKIDEEQLQGHVQQYQEALTALKTTVHAEDVEKSKKLQASKRQSLKTKASIKS
ncbi:probable ATP-dependent RNA helicase Dbp73D [Atheta coriaria]|uniref:probable ATP-dependent RNA helicase Dbp73D n=1 Tax=Dalotia coriaria TaxID=877792 RepID=UPI0031F3BC47